MRCSKGTTKTARQLDRSSSQILDFKIISAIEGTPFSADSRGKEEVRGQKRADAKSGPKGSVVEGEEGTVFVVGPLLLLAMVLLS